jgi:drug/metabolite transporter (DMT)-like permease
LYWLVLASLTSLGFGQLFKWSQRRGCHAPTVVSANYLTLAAVLAIWHLWTGNDFAVPASVIVGGAMGLSFIVAMLVMTGALERFPVGMVLTSFRLSILAPVVVSVWLWGESLSAVQASGIGLALVALALISMSRSSGRSRPVVGAAALLTALAVFATQGVGQICLGWVHYAGLDEQRLTVLMTCAATAGTGGGLVLLVRRHRPRIRDLHMGVGIGLFNLVALATTLTALMHLDRTLFFPVTGCLVVLLDGLFAHLWWKERMGRVGALGAGLGALALLLVL